MLVLERAFYLILVLGTLVFVHEFGHFLAAKFFGIRVEVFSLGFGPRLAGFRRGDTDYRVAAVPLGGYVKMAGEYDEHADPDDPALFTAKPRWQRLVVFFAGPAMNVVLAIVLWWGILVYGDMELDIPQGPPVVEEVRPDSPAAAAGIEPGDRILALGDLQLESYAQYGKEVLFRPGQEVDYHIERDGRALTVPVHIAMDPLHGVGYDGIGVATSIIVRAVLEGSPAASAGVEIGDRIIGLDGHAPASMESLIEYIQQRAGQRVVFEVVRGDQRLELSVVPQATEEGKGRIGVSLGYPGKIVRYPPGEALMRALSKARENVRLLLRTVSSLVRMKVGVGVLSGPLEIARITQDQAQYGWRPLFGLLAFISINLGIFNLLPIPVLDGGNILILLVESSIRRDLTPRIKEVILQVGFVVLLTFAVTVIALDLRKAFVGRSEPTPVSAPAPSE